MPPNRIEDALLRWRTEPASGMLVDGERQLNHGQLALWALRFAAQLTQSGVAPGERVALYLEHGLEAVVALHGAWIAGALAVPIHQTCRCAKSAAAVPGSSGGRPSVGASTNVA